MKFRVKTWKIKFYKKKGFKFAFLIINDYFHFKITSTLVNRENLEKSAFLCSLSKQVFSQVQTMSLFLFSVGYSTIPLSSTCNLDDNLLQTGTISRFVFHLPLA